MDRKSKIIVGLLVVLIGIVSYYVLVDNWSINLSKADFGNLINGIISSIKTDLGSSSIGSPTEPIPKLQQTTVDDINQYRTVNNIPPLTMINEEPSDTYAKVLLSEHCLQHVQDNGITPQGRFHNAGIDSFAVGENLAGGQKAVFDSLENFIKTENYNMMFRDADSDWGHKKNILDPSYMAVSIGIAYDATNMVIVEDFLSTLPPGVSMPASTYSDIPDSKSCW